jgi:outer membrane protein
VLDAQRQLYTSVRDYNNSRYDYILDNLRLKQAAGTLSPARPAGPGALLKPTTTRTRTSCRRTWAAAQPRIRAPPLNQGDAGM